MASRFGPLALASLALCSSALLAAPVLSQIPRASDSEKRAQTRELLHDVIVALFGERGGLGYIADMGALPASLEDLAAPSGTPSYSTANPGRVGMGFNGPYLPRAGAGTSPLVDAWGTPITLVASGGTLRLRSAGPDRNASTSADNLHVPILPRTTHGIVQVTVTRVPEGGGTSTPLDDSDVDVRVYYASHGAQASSPAVYTGTPGVFQLANVHVGRHHVTVAARVPEDYVVATGSDTVSLSGARVQTAIQLTAH